MKHRHFWMVFGATAACLAASWFTIADRPPRADGLGECNFALVIPMGFAALLAVELVAYVVTCLVLGIARVLR